MPVLARSEAMPCVPICVASFFSRGEAGHPPRLVDAPGERLLAVDMLAQLHGRQAHRRVHMVGNADDDRVDLLVHRIEHLAVIAEPLGLWEIA